MSHQLDVEPARKDLAEPHEQLARGLDLAVDEEAPNGAGRAAREREQTLGPRCQLVQSDQGLPSGAILQVGIAGQGHQVAVAGLVLGQQQEPRCRAALLAGLFRPCADCEVATDDRLHARVAAGLGECQRTEHVAAIGDGAGRHPPLAAGLDQLVEPDRPFQQRIGGTDPEVDEVGVGHG